MNGRIRKKVVLMAALCGLCPSFAHAQAVIGVVEDGPLPRPIVSPTQLEQEIRRLVGDEFVVSMPTDKRLDGGWSIEGVRAVLQQQLDDPDVDIIITTGLIASN